MELEGQQIARYLIYSFTQLPCLFHSHLLPLFIPTIADHFPSILLFKPAKINAKQAAEVSTVDHLKTPAGFMWHGCVARFFIPWGVKPLKAGSLQAGHTLYGILCLMLPEDQGNS